MSLRKAINAQCRACIYDPHEPGTWLQQVIDCTCTRCPLYAVRPQRCPSAQARTKAGRAGKGAAP